MGKLTIKVSCSDCGKKITIGYHEAKTQSGYESEVTAQGWEFVNGRPCCPKCAKKARN